MAQEIIPVQRIVKTDEDFHLVYGVVYSPLAVDSHGETMSADEVRRMAHDFLYHGRNDCIDVMHNNVKSGAKVVESFLVRANDPDFPYPGAWVLGIKLPAGPLWDEIRSGNYSGFSLQAVARKTPRKVTVNVVKATSGRTEVSATESVSEHGHDYFVELDEHGRVLIGMTTKDVGHTHPIRATVSTEKIEGHSHRYFIE